MKLSREFVQFNRELILGEIGALIGILLAPLIASRFTSNAAILSSSAVGGGMVMGSIFWLLTSVGHETARGSALVWKLGRKIAFFSPAAFVLGMLVYQPVLWLLSYWLIAWGVHVLWAAWLSQTAAFTLFLCVMNLYRWALRKFAGKRPHHT
ncbi:MAG TPA: hypothetical protein VFY06_13870 [Verrucomicrobiae bacterium]|nr:hypothetical protein [Verrucomicrobiae bacterium]